MICEISAGSPVSRNYSFIRCYRFVSMKLAVLRGTDAIFLCKPQNILEKVQPDLTFFFHLRHYLPKHRVGELQTCKSTFLLAYFAAWCSYVNVLKCTHLLCDTEKNAVKLNNLSIIKHYLRLSFFPPRLIQCQTFSCQSFRTWQLSDLVLRLLRCGHIWVCNTKEFQSETQPGFNESRKHCSFFVFHYDKQTTKNIFGLT